MMAAPWEIEPPPEPDDGPPEDYRPPADLGARRTPDRTPPHDDSAERYVLSAALLSPDALDECARLLTAADFYQPAHETLWRALQHLRGRGEPTAAPAVVAHLVDTRELPRVGQGLILDLATDTTVVPHTAPHYAARVDSLSRRRQGIAVMQRGLQRLQAPGADHDVDEALNDATAVLSEARDNLGNPPPITTWSPVDLEPVLAGEFLDPPPVILQRDDGQSLIYAGHVHTIAGESGSGKTWFALLGCLQEVQAGKKVVFLDFEDRADRVIARLMALGATLAQVRAHFAYIRPDRPLDDDGRAQLAPALEGASLVIVDGVTEAMTMHGLDLNSNSDSAVFQQLLPRWIADRGPAVAMIDHVVKDKESQGRFALGAQHKLAGIDGVAYLVKMVEPFSRGKRGLSRIEVGKDRPGHVQEFAHGKVIAEFALDATSGSDIVLVAELSAPGQYPGARTTFEPTHIMEAISRAVQANPGLGKQALENMVNGRNSTKRTALELLISKGHVATRTAARGKIEHVHVTPYYADQDPDQEDE